MADKMNSTQRDGSKMSHNSAPVKAKLRNLQYLIEPEMVQAVWDDRDPNMCV